MGHGVAGGFVLEDAVNDAMESLKLYGFQWHSYFGFVG